MSQNALNNQTYDADFIAFRQPASAGTTCFIAANHTDTTNAGSTAQVVAQATAASGADAYHISALASTRAWCHGIDASDGESLKEATQAGGSTSPSTGTVTRKVTTAGEQTMPLQPAFEAYKSADTINILGNNTAVSPIIFDTELFDVQGSYNNATGVFTASVTGYYLFSAGVGISSIDTVTHVDGYLALISSGASQSINLAAASPASIAQASGTSLVWSGSAIMRLAVGETVQVEVNVGGGLATATLAGNSLSTYFRGALLF